MFHYLFIRKIIMIVLISQILLINTLKNKQKQMRSLGPDQILAGGRRINPSQNHEKQFKCKNMKIALNACIKKSCNKYAFICSDINCICQKDHVGCIPAPIQNIKNSIRMNVVSLNTMVQVIKRQTGKVINNIEKIGQKMLQKLKTQFKDFGLNQKQINFINILQTKQKTDLTGNQIFQVTFNSQNKYVYQKQVERVRKYLQIEWDKIDSQINKKYISMDKELNLLKDKFKNHEQQVQIINQPKKIQKPRLFQQSNIQLLRNQQDEIRGFFKNQVIKNVKILYKASENNFLAQKFRQKCYGVRSTLVICETEYGKVIGGYTPLMWNAVENGYAKDQLSRSFLFSLTNNQKIQFRDKESTDFEIYCSKTGGPQFGNRDLIISDRANILPTSCADIGNIYIHQNYKANGKLPYQRFAGNKQGSYFKIKQWQVWKIEFDRHNKKLVYGQKKFPSK